MYECVRIRIISLYVCHEHTFLSYLMIVEDTCLMRTRDSLSYLMMVEEPCLMRIRDSLSNLMMVEEPFLIRT